MAWHKETTPPPQLHRRISMRIVATRSKFVRTKKHFEHFFEGECWSTTKSREKIKVSHNRREQIDVVIISIDTSTYWHQYWHQYFAYICRRNKLKCTKRKIELTDWFNIFSVSSTPWLSIAFAQINSWPMRHIEGANSMNRINQERKFLDDTSGGTINMYIKTLSWRFVWHSHCISFRLMLENFWHA